MALLEVSGITKIYPGVVANDGVSLAVEAGEVMAVLGENGAGKSTLMKILYGFVTPDSGDVRLHGRPVPHPVTAGRYPAEPRRGFAGVHARRTN